MGIRGKVWKFGDDVDTDVIIPAKHLVTTDPKELGLHCLETEDPNFAKRIQPGDVILAGKNFGCGSSREHAPLSLIGAGVACVVAKSFARIFYRNAFNTGLPILECPDAVDAVEAGSTISIDFVKGAVRDETAGRNYSARPIPKFMRELLDAGGLMKFVAQKIT